MKLDCLSAIEKLFSLKEDVLFVYDKMREAFPNAVVLENEVAFFLRLKNEDFSFIATRLEKDKDVFSQVEFEEEICVSIGVEFAWERDGTSAPVNPKFKTLLDWKECVCNLQCDLVPKRELYFEVVFYTASNESEVLKYRKYPLCGLMNVDWL